jgi:hypothetical protein
MSLAGRLSALSPFEKPFSIGVIGPGAIRHSIVVGIDLAGEQPVFECVQCRSGSMVMRVFAPSAEKTNNRPILSMSNADKRLFDRFRLKIAELAGRDVGAEKAFVRGRFIIQNRFWLGRPSYHQILDDKPPANSNEADRAQ